MARRTGAVSYVWQCKTRKKLCEPSAQRTIGPVCDPGCDPGTAGSNFGRARSRLDRFRCFRCFPHFSDFFRCLPTTDLISSSNQLPVSPWYKIGATCKRVMDYPWNVQRPVRDLTVSCHMLRSKTLGESNFSENSHIFIKKSSVNRAM